jgi:uncharacterized membrane protein YqhA
VADVRQEGRSLPRGGDYDISKLYALVVTPVAFVVSALMLTYIDKIAYEKKAAGDH